MLLLVRRFQSGFTNGGIHRLLEKEAEKIQAMYERAFLVRLANNSVDAGELVSSYQTIKDAFYKFHVSSFFFLPNDGFIDFSRSNSLYWWKRTLDWWQRTHTILWRFVTVSSHL
jgi:hypothetical protein